GRAKTLTMRLGQEEVTFVKYDAPGRARKAVSGEQQESGSLVPTFRDRRLGHGQGLLPAPAGRLHADLQCRAGDAAAGKRFRESLQVPRSRWPPSGAYFPPGEGRRVWAGGGDRLFLGIDHSAI